MEKKGIEPLLSGKNTPAASLVHALCGTPQSLDHHPPSPPLVLNVAKVGQGDVAGADAMLSRCDGLHGRSGLKT